MQQAFTHKSVTMFQGIVSLYARLAATEAATKGVVSNRRLLEIYEKVVNECVTQKRPVLRTELRLPRELRDLDHLCEMFRGSWDAPEFQVLDPGKTGIN